MSTPTAKELDAEGAPIPRRLGTVLPPWGTRCGIPACTLPPCDLPWGHDGRMHENGGDGFFACDFEAEHARRQLVLPLRRFMPRSER